MDIKTLDMYNLSICTTSIYYPLPRCLELPGRETGKLGNDTKRFMMVAEHCQNWVSKLPLEPARLRWGGRRNGRSRGESPLCSARVLNLVHWLVPPTN